MPKVTPKKAFDYYPRPGSKMTSYKGGVEYDVSQTVADAMAAAGAIEGGKAPAKAETDAKGGAA